MQDGEYSTVVISRSKFLMRHDGKAAILLEGYRPNTSEPYSVAFEVNLEAIAALRQDLAKAEVFLDQRPGRA